MRFIPRTVIDTYFVHLSDWQVKYSIVRSDSDQSENFELTDQIRLSPDLNLKNCNLKTSDQIDSENFQMKIRSEQLCFEPDYIYWTLC